MNEDVSWALDCHDIAMEIWNNLDNLLVRCIDNKDCPEEIIKSIATIKDNINDFAWCDEICEECDKVLP